MNWLLQSSAESCYNNGCNVIQKGRCDMASFGMKAQVKKFLKEHGVNEIRVGSKMIKLQNAKTIDLISAAAKLGY